MNNDQQIYLWNIEKDRMIQPESGLGELSTENSTKRRKKKLFLFILFLVNVLSFIILVNLAAFLAHTHTLDGEPLQWKWTKRSEMLLLNKLWDFIDVQILDGLVFVFLFLLLLLETEIWIILLRIKCYFRAFYSAVVWDFRIGLAIVCSSN